MFAMVHSNAFLCFRITLSNLSSYNLVKEEEIIIGNLSDFSKNAYYKWEYKGLSSRIGGSSMDSLGLDFNGLSIALYLNLQGCEKGGLTFNCMEL